MMDNLILNGEAFPTFFEPIPREKKDLEDEILVPSNPTFIFHGVRHASTQVSTLSTLLLWQKAGGIHPAGHPVVVHPLYVPARIMNYIFLFHRSIDYNIFLLSIKSKRERKTARVGWRTLPSPSVSERDTLDGFEKRVEMRKGGGEGMAHK